MKNNQTHIGIIGAGAMGCIFAYFLHKRYKISIYEKSIDIVNACSNGIKIDQNDFIKPIISNNPEVLKNCNIIFVFVKSFSTKKAIQSIKNHISKNQIIVTLQNGIGNNEIISSLLVNPVVYGITTIGATKVNLNTIKIGGMGQIIIGSKYNQALEHVYKILNNANLDVIKTFNPDKVIFEKAIVNAAINPLGAIFQIKNGELIQNENSQELMKKIIIEATDVSNKLGYIIDSNFMINKTFEICRNTSNNLCSMLQDILNKRKTEIDFINGKIVEIAHKYNLNAKYNETIYQIIKFIEQSYS